MDQPFVENVRRGARGAWGATEAAAGGAREGVLGIVERAARIYRTAKMLGLDDVLLRVGLQRRASRVGTIGAFGAGLVVGAGAGVLLAPQSGAETRRMVMQRVRVLLSMVEDTSAHVAGEAASVGEAGEGDAPSSQRVAIDDFPSAQRERRGAPHSHRN